jgi:hypothetical protein
MSEPREFIQVNHFRVIVDKNMKPFLSLYKWHVRKNKKTYYAYTNINISGKQKQVAMHRLLTGMRKSMTDHKNRNGLDNRLDNLRCATAKQNSMNRIRKNKHGYRGVYKRKGGLFGCQIQVGGRKIHEHGFKTAKQAALAYDELNRKYHGEFGLRNFKD